MFTISLNEVEYKIRYPVDRESKVLAHNDATKDPWWMYVWASGIALSSYLIDQKIEGKQILEVGPGLGLTSIVLTKHGNNVSVYDINPDVLPYLLLNSQQNNIEMPVWVQSLQTSETYDMVISSDVLYNTGKIPSIVQSMYSKVKENGVMIMVEPDRGMSIKTLETVLTQIQAQFSYIEIESPRGDSPPSDEKDTVRIYTIQK